MFFTLSKVLFFLLSPVTWIGILFMILFFVKARLWRRILNITLLVIIVVFTNPYFYRSMVMLWQTAPDDLNNGKVYEAGILLGGFSGYDINNHGYFDEASDRFIQTVSLYHQGKIKKIIMTGGNGTLSRDMPPESFFIQEQLIKNGIPKSDIILESDSRNTFENAINTQYIIDSLKMRGPFLLITSAMHMPRSERLFKKAGVSIQPYPCNYKVYNERFSLADTLAPDPSLLVSWKHFIKEVVGLLLYQALGKA